MTRAEIIAALALLVSLASVSFSVYFNVRDRGRLKATSEFCESDQVPAHVVLTFLNLGRRPIILRMWGGVSEKGEWAGTMIDSEKSGRRLGEHERYEITLWKQDLEVMTPNGDDIVLVDLWVEDSLGRRHAVESGKANAPRLLAS